MKKYPLLLTLTACVVLAACQPQAARPTFGGDPLFADQVSVDSSNPNALNVQEEVAQYTESQRQLVSKLYEYYQEIKGIDLSIVNTTSTDKGTWVSQVTTQESYDAGTIKSFYAQKNTKVGEMTFQTGAYYDGTDYYTQIPNRKWAKNDDGMGSIRYLDIVGLLLNGDKLEMVEGLDQPVLSKMITDSEQLAKLGNLLDMPMTLSPEASYEVKIEAFMNKETGQVVSASISGNATDKGNTYPIDIRIQTTEQPDRTTVSVDVNADVAALSLEGDQALESFKQGNPLEVVNAYQMQWGVRNHDTDEAWLWIANPWNGKMLAVAEGKIADKKVDNYRLLYNGQSYGKDANDEVSSYIVVMEDFYRHFVTRFIDRYAELSRIPSPEDVPAEEITTTTFRESFDADGVSLQEAVGRFDVSNVVRDGAVYAIDYIVNNQTAQLEAVYVWSITENEDSISVVNTLHFIKINEFSPNLINHVIPKEFWQAVK